MVFFYANQILIHELFKIKRNEEGKFSTSVAAVGLEIRWGISQGMSSSTAHMVMHTSMAW
jgi:hypothetical protein